jgi:hypothetical protein
MRVHAQPASQRRKRVRPEAASGDPKVDVEVERSQLANNELVLLLFQLVRGSADAQLPAASYGASAACDFAWLYQTD